MKTEWLKNCFLFMYCLLIGTAVIFILLFSVFSYYRYPLLFPRIFTLEYWLRGVMESRLFWEALGTSCTLGILNGAISCTIGFLTARNLSKASWFNRRMMTLIYSVPLLIPAMTLFIGVHHIMIRVGLINTWLGVVLAHALVTIPYTTTLFLGFFKGISPELETVAQTLGAGKRPIFFRILLPLIRPILYMALAISFLISFSEYFSTALIGGGQVITLSGILYPLISNGSVNHASVMSLVFLAVNGAALLLADRLARKSAGYSTYLYG